MSNLRIYFIFLILLGSNGCFNETGVTIISEPGVFVYINGNEVGEIDASGQLIIKDISPGDYTALLVKSGFEPVEDKFTYVGGQNLIINTAPFDKENNTNYSEIEDQAYENQMEKTEYLTFTDERDGHEYKYVKIGEQFWMAENLAYIPHVSPTGINGGIWVYGYNGSDTKEAKATASYQIFGCLYNWETAKKSCPKGWHLPSDAEWKQLEIQLGIESKTVNNEDWRGTDEACQLKAIGNKHWQENNECSTDKYGFTALPAGSYLSKNTSFYGLRQETSWWTADYATNERAWNRAITFAEKRIRRYHFYKDAGISVRCVKNSDK